MLTHVLLGGASGGVGMGLILAGLLAILAFLWNLSSDISELGERDGSH